MTDCMKCPGYKGCTGKEFYSYEDIRWCPYQIIWIIENIETLKEGIWPDNPDHSGYTDPAIKSQLKAEGYFVKASITVGEVEARLMIEDKIVKQIEGRLRQADVPGQLLIAEIRAGIELNYESGMVLKYLCGWRRKRMSYMEWRRQWRYRQK